MTPSPLDIAAQITLLYATLQESGDEATVAPLLQRALQLAGIKDVQVLILRKSQGLSVFGQVPNYPQASAKDTTELIRSIQDVSAVLPDIQVPVGRAIPYPANWEFVTTPSAQVTLQETGY